MQKANKLYKRVVMHAPIVKKQQNTEPERKEKYITGKKKTV